MSFLTGVKAIEPSTSAPCQPGTLQRFESSSGVIQLPKSVVRDSAASRKSLVGMALPLSACTWTSLKVLWSVSNHVPPDGKGTLCGTAMIWVKNFNGQLYGLIIKFGWEARGCRRSVIGLGIDLEILGTAQFISCKYIPCWGFLSVLRERVLSGADDFRSFQ